MTPPLMKHNPAFLTPEQLAASFVVRRRDLEIVLQYIRDNTGPSNQHVLVIAPRGMGKTTLVRMAAQTVRSDPELGRRWYPLLFGEESYTVASAGELWLEALLHLADQTGDDRWAKAREALLAERDETRLCERALGTLMQFADQEKKRMLLVVENLHMLLGEQLNDRDEWSLRHTLQNEPRIMLLGTATSRFEAIDNEKRALFEMFATYSLEPLDLAECRTLWNAVGQVEADERRVRPMQILTGGNPRLLAILASFAAKTSLRDLMENLAQLVDDHTDYFKSHMEVLPAAERKVYATLADIWAPATAREVAESARLETNHASALLHRLSGRGAVVAEGAGRKVRYRLSERLYNIYHLMRRRGAGGSRVRAVVDFMVHFYEGEELAHVLERVIQEANSLEHEKRQDHYDVFIEAAAAGQAVEAVELLESASIKDLFEPLLVALKQLIGQPVDAPQEVLEIASDVRQRIEQRRAERERQAASRAAAEAAPAGGAAAQEQAPPTRPSVAKSPSRKHGSRPLRKGTKPARKPPAAAE